MSASFHHAPSPAKEGNSSSWWSDGGPSAKGQRHNPFMTNTKPIRFQPEKNTPAPWVAITKAMVQSIPGQIETWRPTIGRMPPAEQACPYRAVQEVGRAGLPL